MGEAAFVAGFGMAQDVAREASQRMQILRRDQRQPLQTIAKGWTVVGHQEQRAGRRRPGGHDRFFGRLSCGLGVVGGVGTCSSAAMAANASGRRRSFSTIRTSLGVNSN